jgi:transposase
MPDPLIPYVGLDIAKLTLHYALDEQHAGVVPNTPAGHTALIALLPPQRPLRVVCEATGGYERAVLTALQSVGIETCIVFPQRVRHFARAVGCAAKTDAIDAQVLRRFGEQCQPRVGAPPDPARTALRELLEQRRALLEQQGACENRQRFASPDLIRLINKQLQFLDKQLTEVEQLVRAHLAKHPVLLAHSQRLQQITGIGPICAWSLLAWLPQLSEANNKELAALVGVAPYAHDSGQHTGKRHTAGGRAEVRRVLHMAARSARLYNPILRAFGDRLESRGKPYKVIITAISRKLLIVLRRLATDPDFVLA